MKYSTVMLVHCYKVWVKYLRIKYFTEFANIYNLVEYLDHTEAGSLRGSV